MQASTASAALLWPADALPAHAHAHWPLCAAIAEPSSSRPRASQRRARLILACRAAIPSQGLQGSCTFQLSAVGSAATQPVSVNAAILATFSSPPPSPPPPRCAWGCLASLSCHSLSVHDSAAWRALLLWVWHGQTLRDHRCSQTLPGCMCGAHKPSLWGICSSTPAHDSCLGAQPHRRASFARQPAVQLLLTLLLAHAWSKELLLQPCWLVSAITCSRNVALLSCQPSLTSACACSPPPASPPPAIPSPPPPVRTGFCSSCAAAAAAAAAASCMPSGALLQLQIAHCMLSTSRAQRRLPTLPACAHRQCHAGCPVRCVTCPVRYLSCQPPHCM